MRALFIVRFRMFVKIWQHANWKSQFEAEVGQQRLQKLLWTMAMQFHWWMRQANNIEYFKKRHHNPHYLRNNFLILLAFILQE
jgi:hypothetical protein